MDLYCITAEKYSNNRDNIQVVREMLKAGIKVIQYREKKKTMRDKYQECQQIKKLTKEYRATLIVNDQVDLAMAVEADGIHIGQQDLPIDVVRGLVGDEKLIGLSIHSLEQAAEAVKKGVDYIGLGPVFSTKTKEDSSNPVGLNYLKYVVDKVDIPIAAIGGIKEDNISAVAETGVDCICLISEIVGADDIGAKIRSLRKQLG